MKFARRFSVSGHDCHLVQEGGIRAAWRVAYRDLRTGYRMGRTTNDTVAIIGHKLGGGGMWVIHDTPNGLIVE